MQTPRRSPTLTAGIRLISYALRIWERPFEAKTGTITHVLRACQ
jgi:hypothetical protein